MAQTTDRPKPVILPELCKGCGRCIDACPKHCIELGHEINQRSGLIPVSIDYDVCNGCGICISACPEPYGLTASGYDLEDPNHLFGQRNRTTPTAVPHPPRWHPLPKTDPLVMKGNHAVALGAIVAGCRHVFGYPITPSTEGAELMAKLLPRLHGVFLQAVSEVATVNHMYGCGGAGLPCMTFTSSPGFSLMLEGISYMIGAEVPGVFLNAMRGGPGLGNIGPEQADIKLVCRGLGHGNSYAPVLAPTTPQEMLDLTIEAFRIAFEYRTPVIIAADGYLGQMTGKVQLPDHAAEPGLPSWAVWGDDAHRSNLICSIYLAEPDLEAHNQHLNAKYRRIVEREQRSSLFWTDDADILVVACNTPARMAKGAVEVLRNQGVRAGLFAPHTLWPFPIDSLREILPRVSTLFVVEASAGQLEDEVRLALSRADIRPPKIGHLRRMGGVLPQVEEIVSTVTEELGVRS